MAATDFIVGIELGSTEITGIAGKKNSDGSIKILAYASEHSSDCIKKGIIYNLDKTTQCLTSVINKLEQTLEATVKKVYVGIGGQSIRSIHNTETKQLNEDTKISQALIDSIMNSNHELSLIDQEILAVEPQEYKLGNNQLTNEPVGIPTDRIEAHFLNIIARSSLKSNIRHCFRQTGYEVAEYLISPLITANVLLTDSEKRSGCALIDLGADTTTVSVYKNNILRHLAVIPLGGANITKDLCSLFIEEEDAEQLKLNYASAYTELTENDEEPNKEYNLDGKCTIRARKLEEVVEARVKEILENVWNQIKVSGYSDKLLAGVVITGGGAKMPNIDKAFTLTTQIEKIRIALSSSLEIENETPTNLTDGTQNTLMGILSVGKENCCKIDPRKGHQLDFINDLQEKEEAEKLKAEKQAEAERIKAEQEAEAERVRAEQRAEAERIRQLQEAKLQQEKERTQKRIAECDELLNEARKLLHAKKYKFALTKAEEAQSMRLIEREGEIEELIREILKQKKDNNPFSNWFTKLRNGAEEMMND